MITVDNYGNEVIAARSGHVISFAHDITTESAGTRSDRGLNYRGMYHYKCSRCQLVWLGKTDIKCYPHTESASSGWDGDQLGYMHNVAKPVDIAWKHLYRS